MIQGFSTLGAVALRLADDNYRMCMRANSKYTMDQAVEVVCFQKRTMAGTWASYVWWSFEFDEGEISVQYDIGKLKPVPLRGSKKRSWRYVPAGSGEIEPDEIIKEWTEDSWRAWRSGDWLSAAEKAMFQMGVQPGQRCLSRYSEQWSQDYYGESDCDISCELLYVEPLGDCSHIYLPIPLGDLGIARPKMKGLSVA